MLHLQADSLSSTSFHGSSSSLTPLQDKKSTAAHSHSLFKSDAYETFSACLLVMDDNHRLTEWIAYHYFVLSLRYLVVAVDPSSKTSPSATLQRWKDPKWNMTVIEWSDTDFAQNNATGAKLIDIQRSEHDNPISLKLKHRSRQNRFYTACIKYLHVRNRTWTSFHDVDEFMAVNSDVFKPGGNKAAEELMGKPGSVLRLVQKYSSTNVSLINTTKEPVTWYKHFQHSPCVTIARTRMGAVESSVSDVSRNVPDILAAHNHSFQFETLRWRYRAARRGERDGLGKSIIDVSRLQPQHLAYDGGSAHRPLAICPGAWNDYSFLPIGIYHFLGSWEAYSFRDDARKGTLRSREIWLQRAKEMKGGADDGLRPWVSGFVNMFGKDEAYTLFRDIGLPPGYRKSENETATWSSLV